MSDVLILNEEIPPELREAIDRDAKAKNLSTSTVASQVLAERYDLTVSLRTPFPVYRQSSSERFKLRVPENVHRRLRLEAAEDGNTIRGIVLNALSTHYGTTIIEPTRRPRKETAA